MRPLLKFGLAGAGAAMLLGGWVMLRDHQALPPAAEASVPASAQQIERGRYLAAAGNCMACHTVPGQAAYAGGRRIGTPFGDVFSSNLTPDAATGIGSWTFPQFWAAIHDGRSPGGRRLSPAFPYTNYTRVRSEDAQAIFAYLRSLPAVQNPVQPAQVRFPYNTQWALAAWRLLYFRPGTFQPDPDRSSQWNRGAYLVEGLGHCNACHTARTWLGGTERAEDYAGAAVPTLGWDALPLTSEQAMSDNDAAEMAKLLKSGVSQRDAVVGPMAEVVYRGLQDLDDQDIQAMVTYLRSLPARPIAVSGIQVDEAERQQLAGAGASVYKEHCSACHGAQGQGKDYVYPALAGNRLVNAGSANDAIRLVLLGGYGPSTRLNPRPYGMPSFAHQLSSEQIAAALTYVRNAWGNHAPGVSPVAVGKD